MTLLRADKALIQILTSELASEVSTRPAAGRMDGAFISLSGRCSAPEDRRRLAERAASRGLYRRNSSVDNRVVLGGASLCRALNASVAAWLAAVSSSRVNLNCWRN